MRVANATGDAVLLQLMWLASPALPVGGFSYSEALEAAVDTGRVTGEASAADWLLNQMALAPARADLPVLAQAHDAWLRHDLVRVTHSTTSSAAPARRASCDCKASRWAVRWWNGCATRPAATAPATNA